MASAGIVPADQARSAALVELEVVENPSVVVGDRHRGGGRVGIGSAEARAVDGDEADAQRPGDGVVGVAGESGVRGPVQEQDRHAVGIAAIVDGDPPPAGHRDEQIRVGKVHRVRGRCARH